MKIREILGERRLFYTNLVLIVLLLGVALPIINIVAHHAATANSGSGNSQAVTTGADNGGFKALPAKFNLGTMQNSFRNVVSQVLPTVVEVNVVDVVQQQSGGYSSPFDFLFGGQQQPQARKQYGLGSGVIVKQTGNTVYVLTNNHVAGNASTISVKLSDGRHFKATLVGKDPNRDLAVIKFQTNQKVPVATLGNSTDIAPGDWVLAIGNPLGYQSTVTAGIVSALDRQAAPNSGLGVYTDYIQTDAAINPGNSGGALVNMQGQVVGINTWIASKSGGSIGIGFAIPINIAHKVMNDLINTGHVAYGWTGVNVGDPPQAVTDSMGLSSTPGAFVYDVYKNSPAYRAGLLPGDYVTKVNGSKVTDTSELLYTIANLNPGATVDFTLIRQGRMMNVNVTIGKRAEGQNMANEVSLMWPGLAVLPLTPDIQNQVGLPSGVGKVIISSVENGSRSAHAGFQPGDVIQAINGRTINNLKDFYAAIDSSNTSHFEFKIFRQGAQLLVGLNKA